MTEVQIKSPLERILEGLKKMPAEQGAAGSEMVEVLRLVQNFMRELEHEKANAVIHILQNCHSMERVEFYRGKLAMIRTLQRDFVSE